MATFIFVLLIPSGVFGIKDYNSVGTELKYEDGTVDWGWGLGGYAVKFSVGEQLWIVDKVRIKGQWIGKDKTFEIEVWDEDLNKLARSGPYYFSEYFSKEKYEWTSVNIPDVEVTGNFYVAFFQDCDYGENVINIGFDDSGEGKENSFFATRNPNEIFAKRSTYTYYNGPVTWLIRIVGYEGNVILANFVDNEYSSIIKSEIKSAYRNAHFKRVVANKFENYKKNKIVIILGGPDAYGGVGEIVDGILTKNEKEYLRTEGNYAMYVKKDIWREKQVVIVLAGCDREKTFEAVKIYRDAVISEIENALFG